MCNPKFIGNRIFFFSIKLGDYSAYVCTHSYQCDTGFFCNTSTSPANCQVANATTSSPCLDDNQCSTAGDICLSGTCQSNKCRSNNDCSNQYCNLSNNTCTTFITRGSACTNDLQCNTTDDYCDSSDSTCK